ncbi:MAG: pentapeptide repeat-containing protein [Lyngbya sp. HA4199-MV5]|nr:pentapeptide repeat-containing protein [Lyngbya sp. HA4199-MV5]
MSQASLKGASLDGADLQNADVSGANLLATSLRQANLTRLQALSTNFTGANFTGACLEDWNINSATQLDHALCICIYLKQNQQERRPSSNQSFEKGEFTKLFQKALSTVDLIFRNGVDWEALLISLEKLRVEAEGAELSIQAIENKNDGAFVVRVNVPPDADKATVETYLKQEYDLALKVLDEKYRYELKAKDIEIESYRRENTNILRLAEWAINRPINVQTTATAESKSVSETFNTDLRGANVTNYVNKLQDNARQQAILHNYAPEQRQTLAEAAAEIQQLLEQLSQTYPTTTQTEKMALVTKAVEEIEKNPTLKARVVGALKAGGVETLKELIDNPLVNVLLAALEGWQEAE